MTATKTISANIFFHFVILGLVLKPLSTLDNLFGYWLILFGLFSFMNPIIAYFCGWDMNYGASCTPADAPKLERFAALIMSVFVYILGLLIWLGVIAPVPRENTGMVLGYLYSVVV